MDLFAFAVQSMSTNETTKALSTPRVPLEIQEHIVQFLDSSSKEAYSAILVCRAWHPSATRQLYYALDFRDDEDTSRLARLALEHPQVRKHLCFTRIAIFHRTAYSASFPSSLSGLFTTLQTVRLRGLEAVLNPSFLQGIPSASITRLELTEIRLPSSHSQLEQLATALCSLKELDIDHLLADTGDSIPRPPTFTPSISARLQKASISIHRVTILFNVYHERPKSSALLPMWGVNAPPVLDSFLQTQCSLYIAFIHWVTSVSSCQPQSSLELARNVPSNQMWTPHGEGTYDAHLEDVNRVLRMAGSSLYKFGIMYTGNLSHI